MDPIIKTYPVERGGPMANFKRWGLDESDLLDGVCACETSFGDLFYLLWTQCLQYKTQTVALRTICSSRIFHSNFCHAAILMFAVVEFCCTAVVFFSGINRCFPRTISIGIAFITKPPLIHSNTCIPTMRPNHLWVFRHNFNLDASTACPMLLR
ncbi:MAG: hypothetical protein ACI808_003240 [Paraglaciecola sp.]|jgi:hypothetical protein